MMFKPSIFVFLMAFLLALTVDISEEKAKGKDLEMDIGDLLEATMEVVSEIILQPLHLPKYYWPVS